MQVQWTVLSIVEGMIYFQEYQAGLLHQGGQGGGGQPLGLAIP
jgi:hypothetical protein